MRRLLACATGNRNSAYGKSKGTVNNVLATAGGTVFKLLARRKVRVRGVTGIIFNSPSAASNRADLLLCAPLFLVFPLPLSSPVSRSAVLIPFAVNPFP